MLSIVFVTDMVVMVTAADRSQHQNVSERYHVTLHLQTNRHALNDQFVLAKNNLSHNTTEIELFIDSRRRRNSITSERKKPCYSGDTSTVHYLIVSLDFHLPTNTRIHRRCIDFRYLFQQTRWWHSSFSVEQRNLWRTICFHFKLPSTAMGRLSAYNRCES